MAIAVSLRLAAGGTVTGASEAALSTLAKLDQVMPPRLRSEVKAIHDSTVTLTSAQDLVDGDVLLTLARACRDLVRVRFGYDARDGAATERWVEPVRLVATGRRWYLMAWDVDREDWRTFRLDRMRAVAPSTWRFTPREHPDPAEYVQRSVSHSPYSHHARVRVHAPLEPRWPRAPTRAGSTLTAIDDSDHAARVECRRAGLAGLPRRVAGVRVRDPRPARAARGRARPRRTGFSGRWPAGSRGARSGPGCPASP